MYTYLSTHKYCNALYWKVYIIVFHYFIGKYNTILLIYWVYILIIYWKVWYTYFVNLLISIIYFVSLFKSMMHFVSLFKSMIHFVNFINGMMYFGSLFECSNMRLDLTRNGDARKTILLTLSNSRWQIANLIFFPNG